MKGGKTNGRFDRCPSAPTKRKQPYECHGEISVVVVGRGEEKNKHRIEVIALNRVKGHRRCCRRRRRGRRWIVALLLRFEYSASNTIVVFVVVVVVVSTEPVSNTRCVFTNGVLATVTICCAVISSIGMFVSKRVSQEAMCSLFSVTQQNIQLEYSARVE